MAQTESCIILVYSTAPVMKVVAKVEICNTLSAAPSILWEQTKNEAGISRRKYREYFKGVRLRMLTNWEKSRFLMFLKNYRNSI